jgi:hypothetical protein
MTRPKKARKRHRMRDLEVSLRLAATTIIMIVDLIRIITRH